MPDSDSQMLHKVLRKLARWAVWSFFTEVRVVGGENVPVEGPIIVYVFRLEEPTSPNGVRWARLLVL